MHFGAIPRHPRRADIYPGKAAVLVSLNFSICSSLHSKLERELRYYFAYAGIWTMRIKQDLGNVANIFLRKDTRRSNDARKGSANLILK